MKEETYPQTVQNYYNMYGETIRDFFGDTYQAYSLADGMSESYASINTFLALRAGIKPGDRVLDAGCGAGGPCVDIAKGMDGVCIDAITISAIQAGLARQLVEKSGLTERICVHTGDFHDLPFAENSFDVVYFFESDAYSRDQNTLFQEAYRVLKPGGTVYVKGVFKKDGHLSEQEQIDFAKMCRMFAWNMVEMSTTERSMAAAGFQNLESNRLDFLSAQDFMESRLKASYTRSEGRLTVTPFGERHHDFFQSGPWYAGEIKAQK